MTQPDNPASQGDSPGGAPAKTATRRPLMRRVLIRCAVVLFAFVAALGLCELALWIIAPLPFHEFVHYVPDGHIRARPAANQAIDNGAGCMIRINKHGFRGPDYAYEKPPGALRIEVFGGSAAFEFKSSAKDKTWPGALEKKLKERLGMPVEVINLGVPGYDSFNSKINYMLNGRAFHPDAIIVYHGWNCMVRFRTLEKSPYQGTTRLPNKTFAEQLGSLTQLGRRGLQLYYNYQGRRLDDVSASKEGSGSDLDRPVAPTALAWERQNYLDFVLMSRSDGVLPIFVSMAQVLSAQNKDDPAIRQNVAPYCVSRGFTVSATVDTMAQVASTIETLARQENAVFIDGFNAVPHDLEHFDDTVHFKDKGSEVLAEKIASDLLADPRFMEMVKRIKAEKPSQSSAASSM